MSGVCTSAEENCSRIHSIGVARGRHAKGVESQVRPGTGPCLHHHHLFSGHKAGSHGGGYRQAGML